MPNRLAQSQSLYLRKHAENPIDWFPWGEEAHEKARRENKPIFLSIGYSSCHWCTVMEGEAFSDWAIADYMNENFVPIKVDREERPDIDSIYMQTLQMMTGQGGWPLNVFLSPDDLVPFYGGTYFPVDPRHGRPGFLQVLQAIRQFYNTETGKVQSMKEEILGRLQQSVIPQPVEELSSDLLRLGLEYSAGVIELKSMGTRFPMIPYADTALRGIRFNFADARYDATQGCTQRGLDLALGGIFDHVGGGFHRYTVDPTWTVPHFEKMLYDNGQIMEFLTNLWSMGVQEPAFARAIALTVAWLKREMTAADGYFYAAQDADSFVTTEDREPEEGAFYVWGYAELQTILTLDELTQLSEAFAITEAGNFEGKIVLQRQSQGAIAPELEAVLTQLFAVRYGSPQVAVFPPARTNQDAKTIAWTGRIPCVTDTKMIVAWNSLMISGLARAAAVFRQPDYLEMATHAAEFIVTHQRVNGRFQRVNYDGTPTVSAQAEDYALFIKALLDLDQAAIALSLPNPSWLDHALSLQTEFDESLWSLESGGYYNTHASPDLVVRERSVEDNATPAANGVAIANLVRLFLFTEDLTYLDRAEEALQAFSRVMSSTPQACPGLFTALDWYRNATLIRTTPEIISQLSSQYLPTVVLRQTEQLPEGAIGMVCQGLSCKDAARNQAQLYTQLQQSLTRNR